MIRIAILLSALLSGFSFAKAGDLYQLKMLNLENKTIDFGSFKDRVLLVVNTASRCGYTKQYGSLQRLYDDYKGKGLEIIAFPSNDFKRQKRSRTVIKAYFEYELNEVFDSLAAVVTV